MLRSKAAEAGRSWAVTASAAYSVERVQAVESESAYSFHSQPLCALIHLSFTLGRACASE